jgi:NAD(P)H-quinone oxidoreductase subunit 5
MSVVLLAVVLLPLLAALAVLALDVSAATAARLAVGASAAACAAALVTLVGAAADGQVTALVAGSDGRAVVGLAADRVGGVLVVLTTFVALIVQSFASRSLLADPRARRFHVLALALTSATSVVAVAATATGVVVAWIATSAALVALLGHRAPWPPAVAAQRRTRWSFLIGDAALVLAVGIALVASGDIDMRTVGADAAALGAERVVGLDALVVVAVLLVVAGIARSALIPIHRWLPSTLAAPTPVSALLHAGVVNGAGVLLIRFSSVFGSSSSAMALAFALGLLTALVATSLMLVRTDVKGSLVWSTSGQMGFMVMQLGVGAFAAALFHIVGHALYKAALFLGAGGTISAHLRQAQRPHLGRGAGTILQSVVLRVALGIVLPLVLFDVALTVIDPHLTAGATILIVVFGSLSIGRAANGWVSSTPFSPATTILMAIAGIAVGVVGYVGGLTIFEHFVADVVPYDVPAAVGPVWVAVCLAVVAAGVALVAFTPGPRGDALRRRTYVWLLSTGSSIPPSSPPPSSAPPSSAPRSSIQPQSIQRSSAISRPEAHLTQVGESA